jgi:hypothetical protein
MLKSEIDSPFHGTVNQVEGRGKTSITESFRKLLFDPYKKIGLCVEHTQEKGNGVNYTVIQLTELGVYATQNFVKGQEILNEMSIINITENDTLCSRCSDTLGAQTYSCGKRCERYCSKYCRDTAHSEYHQYVCGINMKKLSDDLSKKKPWIRGTTLLTLRLIGYCASQGYESPFEDEWFKVFSGKSVLSSIVNLSNIQVPLWFTFQNYSLVTSIFAINCLTTTHGGSSALDVSLFRLGSVVNHSCKPNTEWTVEGNTLILKTLKRIQKREEITISYIDYVDNTEKRAALLKQWDFRCKCEQCK